MLREKLHQMISDEKKRAKLVKVLRLCILVGVIWIFSFPFMAREVFTSENAFNGDYLKTNFDTDPRTIKTFEQIRNEVDQIQDPELDTTHARDYVV